jgi:hypothetical protein
MKKEIGLWIDHSEAIIVIFADDKEEIKRVTSKGQNRTRFLGSSNTKTSKAPIKVTSEDRRDRKFENDLNSFYDEVIAIVRDADSIQIFGPGEAKGELEKRLEREGLKAQVVETTDKMTDRQIAAKVRQRI